MDELSGGKFKCCASGVYVQQNLKWSRPNQQVKNMQKAGDFAGMSVHESFDDIIGAAFILLASFGAQGKSLAKDHGLNGTVDVNDAAGHSVATKT